MEKIIQLSREEVLSFVDGWEWLEPEERKEIIDIAADCPHANTYMVDAGEDEQEQCSDCGAVVGVTPEFYAKNFKK